MQRFLFYISGHLEVLAETLEEAQAKCRDKRNNSTICVTHYDKFTETFVVVVPVDTSTPIDVQPA